MPGSRPCQSFSARNVVYNLPICDGLMRRTPKPRKEAAMLAASNDKRSCIDFVITKAYETTQPQYLITCQGHSGVARLFEETFHSSGPLVFSNSSHNLGPCAYAGWMLHNSHYCLSQDELSSGTINSLVRLDVRRFPSFCQHCGAIFHLSAARSTVHPYSTSSYRCRPSTLRMPEFVFTRSGNSFRM